MITEIPNGLDEIIKTFGPLAEVPKHLKVFDLPYPMLFGNVAVHRAQCHELAVDNFHGALLDIQEQGLEPLVVRFGGIYANRVKRDLSKPSTHAWGIAIDLEPDRYPLGSDKRFPQVVVDLFARWGFVYGGDFAGRRDPMHFQLAAGY